jgi:hypothetical protein
MCTLQTLHRLVEEEEEEEDDDDHEGVGVFDS